MSAPATTGPMLCPTCGAQYPAGAFCATDGTPLVKAGGGNNLEGRVIADRYRLVKLLGQGGMGQVYSAEHLHIAKKFAIKLLRPEITTSSDAIVRFRQEAWAASSIGHENIVEIEDFATLPDGSVYLAMELLDGESLADRMKRAPVTVDEALAIVRQVCAGLGAAHEKGIVHRDLKPENLFVSAAGVVKILDFGIAKVFGGNNEPSVQTRTGQIFGTPQYMSPEQACGKTPGPATDVYSLGVILYELSSGRVPFVGESTLQVLTQHLTAVPPPPSQIAPERAISPELERLILAMMAKEPAERPAIAVVAQQLAALATGTPMEAFAATMAPSQNFPAAGAAAAAGVGVGVAARGPSANLAARPPSGNFATPARGSSAHLPAASGNFATAAGGAATGGPLPAAGSPSANSFPASGSRSANAFPAGSSQSANAFPAGSSQSANAFPAAGSPSANSFPAAGSQSASAFPAAGSQSANAFPAAGSPSANAFPAAGAPASGSKRGLWIALAVFAAAGVAAAVFFFTRPRVTVAVVDAPKTPAPAPPINGAPAPTAPATPTAPAPIDVVVDSIPVGANILLDGKVVGVTPEVVKVAPGAVEHVVLHKDGFVEHQVTVDPAAGSKMVVKLQRLEPAHPHPAAAAKTPTSNGPNKTAQNSHSDAVAAAPPQPSNAIRDPYAAPAQPARDPYAERAPAQPARDPNAARPYALQPHPPANGNAHPSSGTSDPLVQRIDAAARGLAFGAHRVQTFQGAGPRTDWFVNLDGNRCYTFVATVETGSLYLYLWGPGGRRLTDHRQRTNVGSMVHCTMFPGAYHVQAKLAGGAGNYKLGVYTK